MNSLIAPTALLRKGDRGLVIGWNDGARSEYDVRKLRLNCPCAACVNEWNGEKILDAGAVPPDVRPLRLFAVGRYAMGVQWSDGHATGIFSYDYLRRLEGV
jgi:ATP-binding protein involved in chromosome partitioning